MTARGSRPRSGGALGSRAVAASLLLPVGAAPGCADRPQAPVSERQAEVARLGAGVMPFDLERTTHVFEPLSDGGAQTVLADDPADTLQVRLVREHLRGEARRFASGDFRDPARVHGDAMSGLAELREGHGKIEVRFSEVPAGARIRYTTSDSGLVAALHDWFAAQLEDHGAHAEPGSRP